VLFGQENIDRMIEIGPNNTLAAMAKKTLASQYSVTESIRPRKREILCHATDAAQIFEETAVAEVVVPQKDEKPTTAQKSVASPSTPPQAEAPAAAPPQQAGAPAAVMREIADVPISAGDLVTAIVSSKLKKAHDEINRTQSIKTLTGGKLTTMPEPTSSNVGIFHTNKIGRPVHARKRTRRRSRCRIPLTARPQRRHALVPTQRHTTVAGEDQLRQSGFELVNALLRSPDAARIHAAAGAHTLADSLEFTLGPPEQCIVALGE
jgi:hypothetical protein